MTGSGSRITLISVAIPARARVGRLALCLASACVWSSTTGAQEASKAWQWSITPYVWAAGTKGRVGARDVVGSVDVTTGDVLETGKVALMGVLEGRRGRWLGHLDLFYVSTTDDENLAPVLGAPSTLEIEHYQTMLESQVGYSVLTWPKGTVDAVAGLRSWHVKAELTAVLPSMSSGAETSADWVDGIVGAGARRSARIGGWPGWRARPPHALGAALASARVRGPRRRRVGFHLAGTRRRHL